MEYRWYALHTHSGCENRVKSSIERQRDLLGLESRIAQVLVPTEDVAEIRSGEKKITQRKFFPSYVLLQADVDDELWYLIKRIAGVTGFVGGSTPIPLRDEEVQRILEAEKEEKAKPKVMFEPGERVKVVEGPFTNFIGGVEEVNVERGRLKVMINIFERMTPVELEFWQVEKS